MRKSKKERELEALKEEMRKKKELDALIKKVADAQYKRDQTYTAGLSKKV
jgi:hypothetical protein